MILLPIHKDDLGLYWDDIEDYVKKACIHFDNDSEGVWELLKCDGRYQLVVLYDAPCLDNPIGCSVLELTEESVHIYLVAGDFEKGWHQEFDLWLEVLADVYKKKKITGKGRKGWARVMKKFGWVKNESIIERAI